MSYQNNTAWAEEALGIKKKPKVRKRARRLATVPKSIIYPKITPRNPIKVSREEKFVGGAAAYAGRAKLSAAARKLTEGYLRSPVRAMPKGGVITAAALAGAAAYAITTAIINRRARTKQELQENAFQLSQAYRRMRDDLAYKQGRKLTPAQQRAAAAAFQKGLLDLGLSSRDLTKIRG